MTPPKLGRYEIVDEIGKGAMGVVYLARDPLIGRLVALKTFRLGYSVRDQELEQFRIRFMREAQSAGILSHPNIVTIHDVVEQTEEGLAFIAMEYVRGTTLKALLQSDQPMSLQFIVDVVSQVAEALDYAHAHRVIHRDVKPANILITADNKVKITDFGIARLDTSNLTQEGQLLGTPNYMAPEQIQGKEIDHRADLFALGVVLYEMLTRHKPFQGENLTVVSHRIVYDHFTPPKEYARDLPPGVEQVLDRALEKDPSRRYQRARDLAEDLRRVLSASRDDLNETLSIASWAPGTEPARYTTPPSGVVTTVSAGSSGTPPPMAAKPAPPPKKPRQPMSTRRVLMFAGVAAVIAILAAAAILLAISWSGAKDEAAVAATPVQDATQARYLALVKQGETFRDQLKFAEAIQAFGQAMQLAPQGEKARIYGEVQRTEELAADYLKTLDRAGKIATHLADAKIALQDGRFDNALESADALLAIEPTHEEGL
ncbi:MAG TPA: serine/threonine-protein kinase, partial [Thermoanaerobaculia bacterium]|nr:serine/threonine-protein kinase [Thermoanaerobaculia bacterium]